MKITYEWLKEFVPAAPPVEETARRLTAGGLTVESVAPFSSSISGVVVGEVLKADRHPNADRLTLCLVDAGEERCRVVCGAPNVRPGMKAPLAKVGARLPNGMEIKKAKIRGVESFGMLCSPVEVGMGRDADGLLELEPDAAVGEAFVPVPEDWVLDIEVTPNRGDALSVLGVARQLSALLGIPWRRAGGDFRSPAGGPGNQDWTVATEDPAGCGLYAARLLTEAKVASSPDWLARRLIACGFRPISNIVDVTNYVLLETGHPLHAFDADKLAGKRIAARRAREGETIRTLDGVDRKLTPEVLVIADSSGPVAVAGVMGGDRSEISGDTRNILLESAWFDPVRIRRGAVSIGAKSESSYRFERGVDPEGVMAASERAVRLLKELAGVKVASRLIRASGKRPVPRPIMVKADEVSGLLGVNLGAERLKSYARRLGCRIGGRGKSVRVTPPSWRMDLRQPADMIEEFATLHGYGNIPVTMPEREMGAVALSGAERAEAAIRRVLAACGYSEVQNYSFMSEAEEQFLRNPESVRPARLLNPMSREQELMRTSLVPGLLRAAAFNMNRGHSGIRIFEIGRIFHGGKEGAPRELLSLGIACSGSEEKKAHSGERKLDIYDLTGTIGSVLSGLGIRDKVSRQRVEFGPLGSGERSWLPEVSGLRWTVLIDGDQVGALWVTDREFEGCPSGTCCAELLVADPGLEAQEPGDLKERIPSLAGSADLDRTVEPPPAYPAIIRDLAVEIPEEETVGRFRDRILAACREHPAVPLVNVEPFDLYRGRQIRAGRKSVAFRLVFQSRERTLTEAEVDGVMAKVVDALGASGGEIRSG